MRPENYPYDNVFILQDIFYGQFSLDRGNIGCPIGFLNIGTSGDDYMTGTTGADTLIGGQGRDTYTVNNIGDVVVEDVNEGLDKVESSVTFALAANVENLTLTGSGSINGTGNALGNTIYGNSGNNVLDGGAGSDYLDDGYGGNDTYIFGRGYGQDMISDCSTAAGNLDTVQMLEGVRPTDVTVSRYQTGLQLKIAGTADHLILNNWFSGNYTIEQVKFADGTVWDAATIIAKSNIGTSGDDYMTGTTGADTLIGGQGRDIYTVNNIGDVVVEDVNEGLDKVESSVTFALAANVENLTLTGSGSINGTGNALGNTIYGNSGNNVLDGGFGSDLLDGGAGNDTYSFSPGAGIDIINNNDAAGFDTVAFGAGIGKASVGLFRNGNNLEIGYSSLDKVSVSNFFSSANYQVDEVELADGSNLTAADINKIVQDMAAYAVSEGIALGSVNDVRNNEHLMSIIANSWHA